MFWIQVVVVTAVVFVIAAVVLGAGGTLPDSLRDRVPLVLPPDDRPMTAEDVDQVRFPVVLRGYRMSEVDTVLDRLTAEVAARDARIMELEYRLSGVVPAGVGADLRKAPRAADVDDAAPDTAPAADAPTAETLQTPVQTPAQKDKADEGKDDA